MRRARAHTHWQAVAALLLLAACACRPAGASPQYEDFIPNPQSLYPVVLGHSGAGGVQAGSRNVDVFGRDLTNSPGSLSSAWAAICLLDSDGDGRTNGEELGDPGCKWRPGQASPPGPCSNPGIKDKAVVVSPPVTSPPSAKLPPTARPPPTAQPSSGVLAGVPSVSGSGSLVSAPGASSALSATELAIIGAAGVLVLLSVAVRASKMYNERKLVAALAARGQAPAPAGALQVAPWKA
jgi:hypothetical protein